MKNFYKELKLKDGIKKDKNFNKHFILPNSMILAIGGTGTGKTNSLLNMLQLMGPKFYDIIIFTTVDDEPLLNYLKKKIPEIEIYTDINEFPSLDQFENDGCEKLAVFDDFINLKKKDFTKINEFLTAGRKKQFTCFCMAQNYVQVPKTITRNCNYFIVFKLNDNSTIHNIIRNHNIENISKDEFKNMYIDATKEPLNFFMVDLKGLPESRFRKNFSQFYKYGKES